MSAGSSLRGSAQVLLRVFSSNDAAAGIDPLRDGLAVEERQSVVDSQNAHLIGILRHSAQIQAVYDAGYDEWILWDAAVSYDYGALLSEADAEAEAERIAESRAAAEALAAIEAESEAETFPEELQNALNGDELYESDAAVLSQDGPIITYEEEPSQNSY